MTISERLLRTVTSIKFIVSIAIIALLATFIAWQYHNSTNIDRVFWGMVDNSLQTSAYTRHTQQKSGAQSVDQVFETATSPQHRVFSETIFTQTGADSAKAITENIGTTTHGYVRYVSVITAQGLNFSSILDKWGVSEPEVKGKTTGQLYNQAVLGVIPVGNLTTEQRREVTKIMKEKKAYSYELVETKRSLPFGRPTYTLQVTVSPVGYISALKAYASYVGLNHLEDVKPEEFADADKLSFIVEVDGLTHQMVATSQNQGAKTEVISGRNFRKTLPSAPRETIPVEDLQAQLQSIE